MLRKHHHKDYGLFETMQSQQPGERLCGEASIPRYAFNKLRQERFDITGFNRSVDY